MNDYKDTNTSMVHYMDIYHDGASKNTGQWICANLYRLKLLIKLAHKIQPGTLEERRNQDRIEDYRRGTKRRWKWKWGGKWLGIEPSAENGLRVRWRTSCERVEEWKGDKLERETQRIADATWRKFVIPFRVRKLDEARRRRSRKTRYRFRKVRKREGKMTGRGRG